MINDESRQSVKDYLRYVFDYDVTYLRSCILNGSNIETEFEYEYVDDEGNIRTDYNGKADINLLDYINYMFNQCKQKD